MGSLPETVAYYTGQDGTKSNQKMLAGNEAELGKVDNDCYHRQLTPLRIQAD